ncbi:MAG: hypothetical protein WAT39_06860 [Planctomycetota bacterium]
MRTHSLVLVSATCVASLTAQTGTIPGLDGSLTNNASPTYFGRRGAAHPNGEIGMSYSYTMCNPGSVPIQWTAPMNPNHPMFAMMVVIERNGRFEQITDNATTYVKHAFSAANSASTCGGTCQTTGTGLRVNCTDTYGASTNANRHYLAPSSEINPWTGVWPPVGSYIDRGEPDVGPPQNQDGIRSLSGTAPAFTADLVKNRVTLKEQDLLAAGRKFMCCHIVVAAEDGDLHWNNLGHRELVPAWNGTTWTFTNPVVFQSGSVLSKWTGAALSNARNGGDDGHFLVAVKVTPLGGGLYHYEYAVHNFDNHRGGATLRIPVCPTTPVTNVTFRDPNGNPLDDWTMSRSGAELVFTAPATNPLDWNNLFNFGFDCDVAPIAGSVVIDQARVGPGALSVAVNTQVPGGLARVTNLGPGCGTPVPALAANGLPLIPSSGFAFTVNGTANAPVFLFAALGPANLQVAPGCFQYVDGTYVTHGAYVANGSGLTTAPVPIPNTIALEGAVLDWQAAEAVVGGPLLGFLALSNGLEILVATR